MVASHHKYRVGLLALSLAALISVGGCRSPWMNCGPLGGGAIAWPAIPVDWPWKKKTPPPDTDYLQACQQLSYFVSEKYWQQPPQRVLLICPDAPQIPERLQRETLESIASQLRQERLFEVIVHSDPYSCHCNWNAIVQGRFDEYQLLEQTQRFNCDAILIVRIHQFQTNWPMNVAVTGALIDRQEASVMMAADGQWDLNDARRLRIYESYLNKFAAIDPNWSSIQQQSPQQLQRYIGWQFAQVLSKK